MKFIYLIRHGQTEWSETGKHTGCTDIALTNQGRKQAKCLLQKLSNIHFERVFTSPLKRCLETCELAGFSREATVDRNLMEWNYGIYEGWTKQQILREAPGWNIFSDGAPKGESVEEVKDRASRILQKALLTQGNMLVFSHGHFLRLFLTQWLQIPCKLANAFMLANASISYTMATNPLQVSKCFYVG